MAHNLRRNHHGEAFEGISLGMLIDLAESMPVEQVINDPADPSAIFWEFDLPRLKLTALAGNLEQLTGYCEAELPCDRQFLNYVFEADRSTAELTIVNALARRGAFELECRLRKKDGSTPWTRTTGVWRSPTVVVGMTTNIQHRILHRESLRQTAMEGRIFSLRLSEAIEKEKRRQAQFLHDELGQLVVGMLMDIDWFAAGSHPENSPASTVTVNAGDVERHRNNMVSLFNAIRGQSHELLPSVLEQPNLEVALEWLSHLYERRTALHCMVEFVVGPHINILEKEERVALFRIAQEAMTNIWKHAKATSVALLLREEDNSIALTIKDDGVGMVVSPDAWYPGAGLWSMKERAKMIGATFEIASCPGNGTALTIRMPVARLRLPTVTASSPA